MNIFYCVFSNPLLAVGISDEVVDPQSTSPKAGEPKVVVYEYSENSRRWAKTEAVSMVTDPVHDIKFAPNLGQPHHLLAVASKDVKLVMLKPTV